ncbi:unnamed protein product [Ectocarpus sp. 8 AP-2014]
MPLGSDAFLVFGASRLNRYIVASRCGVFLWFCYGTFVLFCLDGVPFFSLSPYYGQPNVFFRRFSFFCFEPTVCTLYFALRSSFYGGGRDGKKITRSREEM